MLKFVERRLIKPLIEPLILYCVLFFPDFGAPFLSQDYADSLSFSAYEEVFRIVGYNLPALALLYYLLHYNRFQDEKQGLVALRTLLPRRADVLPALLAFAGVCAAGYGVSFSASFFEEAPALPFFEGNMSLQAIPLVIVSSLSTGYLEEGFFRYYLFRRFHEAGVNIAAGAAVSILLFAVCHLYEGPWGVLNAALSALVLSCVFLRFRSLHAVALAHGAWNTLVFLSSLNGV